jgi:hypothetical protein
VIGATGHGWALAVFPLGAAVIAYLFAVVLLRQFASRPRPYLLAWAVALLMFGLASQSMFLGVLRGWSSLEYRLYWLFGAILNVPFLFQGEIYLLARNRWWAHTTSGVLLAATAFATLKVSLAPLHTRSLLQTLPLGKDVFGDHSLPYRLAQFYAYPAYFLLLAGLIWSVWQMRARPELRNRTAGTLAIALGATIVAIGSGVGAGLHVVALFSIALAVGIAAMFWGFVIAGRPAASRSAPAAARSAAPSEP